MAEHILLARRVESETDLLVVEKAISFLLPEDSARKVFESEGFLALRAASLCSSTAKFESKQGNLRISLHPPKGDMVKECTITLSLINTETRGMGRKLLPRCSQQTIQTRNAVDDSEREFLECSR
mmetsp:Transcript_44761/g.119276  ORF Transcript_44761/g.119276 Transcript_44761/m.119276 type:complete len:125 (+) Transcript_44761:57-431(+)